MASSDAKPFPLKNTAYRVYFPLLDADGDLVEGMAGLDSEVSKDGATFANCSNEATEILTIVHDTNDTTNAVSSANASNQATLNTLLNEIKADYNAHRVSTTFHDAADSTNVVASADATDAATSVTLANEIKADYNAHRSQADVHPHDDSANAVSSADATDEASCITLANEIKTDYNAHLTATAGSGMAYLDLVQAEMNTDASIIVVKSTTTGAKTTPIVLYPVDSTDIHVNVKAISDDTTAPDNLELDYDGTGYTKTNSTIGTCTTNTDLVSAAAVVNEWESQSQADPTGFHVNVLEIGGTAQTANDNGADINSILLDTAVIGALGAGLTAIPWNSAWDTEVESEVTDALIALNLDHLMKTATVGADMTAEVVDNTVLSRILANGDTSLFVPSTDGFQPIRDRGDSAWITAAGFSTHSAANVWSVATRQLTGTQTFNLTGNITGNLSGSVGSLTGHTAQTGDSFARLGTPAAASIAADLLAIDNFVDELETRLSAARAGYLDNLSAGAVALAAGVDLTKIHGVSLTETVNGYLAAAFVKLFDVVTPVLTSESVNQSANNNTILAHADYGNAKLVRSTTPANALDVSATGEAGLDFNNIKNAAGAHTLSNITVPTVTALTGKTGFALSSTGANLILKDSTFALALADAVADEVLTGATHNIANSLGRRIREIGAFAIHSGTAQAGNSHSITLAATADANDGIYNRNLIVLVDNTGAGQTRTIVDYDGTTKVAIIDRDFRVSPDATTTYQITPDDTPLVVDHGIAQAGTSTTITLRAYASAVNNNYLCNIVVIIAGTGRGQARLVGSYNGTTKVVTICGDNWVTTPDTTSVYTMIPYGTGCSSCMGATALSEINAEVDTALNTAIPGSPTAYSINERIKAIDELTEGSGSGDLAAILTDTSATIPGTISTLQTDSTAIKAKTDNLPSGIAKNVALPKFDFFMVLSSDHVTAATGKTITGEISKDGGAFAGITNAITEVSNGMYKIASGFTQTEMNADVITLKFTETDCDQRMITIHTT